MHIPPFKNKNIPSRTEVAEKLVDYVKEEVKKGVEKYLNTFREYPYIFNLGHGVLPEIKPEIIEYVIQIIRNKK